MEAESFYDQVAPFYHLIYQDWEASIAKQARDLNLIINEFWRGRVETILDAACGVGTQALGLAALGYTVTASDLSTGEIARATGEAAKRGLQIDFSVADMRQAYIHHQKQFDLTLACDNALPHLLTDADIFEALQQFYRCTRTGGGCLISVRDYEKEERTRIQVKPYGVRIEGDTKYVIFQVWEFEGDKYDLSMYFIEDKGGPSCVTRVMRTKYYAVGIDKLIQMMNKAGFRNVQRLDGRFFQPVIIGTRD